jgi:TPR repeat protein
MAAKAGDLKCQVELGDCFRYGAFGVPKNLVHAYGWYKRAAPNVPLAKAECSMEYYRVAFAKEATLYWLTSSCKFLPRDVAVIIAKRVWASRREKIWKR